MWVMYVLPDLSIPDLYLEMSQPKLADEEGWKRFCIGGTVYKATTAIKPDPDPNSALDYRKVVC